MSNRDNEMNTRVAWGKITNTFQSSLNNDTQKLLGNGHYPSTGASSLDVLDMT